MELRHVRHFLALVETGSLGRASRLLDISQPALSKSIQRLEGELDVRLFDRGTRGATLTRFGKTFLEHARVIASEAHNAEVSIRALRGRRADGLTMGVSPSLARLVMPLASARFVRGNPGVHVNIVTGMVDELFAKVLAGELEFAITAKPEREEHPGLEHELLIETRLEVVAGDHHLLRRKRRIGLEDLVPYPWILPSGAASGRKALYSSFSRKGLQIPNPTIESDSITYIFSFLQETDYLSLLPLSLVSSYNGTGELMALQVRHDDWLRPIVVIYRKRLMLSRPSRRLVDEVRKALLESESAARTLPRKS